jgi:hypothetical protein
VNKKNKEFQWHFCSQIRSPSENNESRTQMTFLQRNSIHVLIKSAFRFLKEKGVLILAESPDRPWGISSVNQRVSVVIYRGV